MKNRKEKEKEEKKMKKRKGREEKRENETFQKPGRGPPPDTGADPGYVKGGGAEIQMGGRVADITRK